MRVDMVEEKRPLNVKIPVELYEKIESTGRQKQDVATDAFRVYFSGSSNQDVANELKHEKEKNQLLQDNIKSLQDNIKTLEKQLGFLQFEYQKLRGMNEQLLLVPSEKEIKDKKWWRFWQR